MRSFRMRMMSMLLLYFLLVNLAGCGGSGGTSSPVPGTTLQKELTSFNTSMDDVVGDMVNMIKTIEKLDTAFNEDDGSTAKAAEIGVFVDEFKSRTTSFLASVAKMEQAESGIQQLTQAQTTGKRVALLPAVVGAVLVIKGLYSFGQKMKDYSEDMTTARNERDVAATNVTNNVPGAEEKYAAAKKDMRDAGTSAVQELATKVTTDLALSPLNPISVTTVILKDVAGNTFQEGLKVLSASEDCASGYATQGCTLGVSKTDAAYPTLVPSGKTTVVVGGGTITKTARTVIDDETFPPGETVEITRVEIPVATATSELINKNDGGAPAVVTSLTLSKAKLSEDSDSITYTVSAAVADVTAPTTVAISVQNGATGSSTQAITGDSTVLWTVTVLDTDATVTVTRRDNGEQQTLVLPGKVINFDGEYAGTLTLGNNYIDPARCNYYSNDFKVIVSGHKLTGSGTTTTYGTLSGNVVDDGYVSDFDLGIKFTFLGTINGTTMSGSWRDWYGICDGTFSWSKL